MEPLTWGLIAQLILTYGVPFTEQLVTNAQNNKPVTLDEWNALKLKINTPFDQIVPKQ